MANSLNNIPQQLALSLPKGWQIKKLGEVCDKISLNGIKIKQKDYLVVGKFPVVDQGQEIIGGYYNDEKLVVPTEPPYIIFGDHTKVKKFINFKFIAGADGVKVLKPHSIYDPKFFFYLIHSVKIPDKGYARHFQFLEKENIPLPPLPEQLAIVSKIEELFSELDKGVESLKTAQQQLKVYRQSLLKWAFEGRLTSTTLSSRPIFPSVAEQNKAVVERSRNHRSKVVTTASLAAEEKEKYGIQNELPEGWKWVKIDVLLADKKKGMSTGPFGTMLKKSEHQKNGVPVLGIENIGEGIFQMPNKIFITNEKAFELKNFRVKDNDIIISRSGTVGEICLLPKRMENAIISTNLIRVRLNQDVIYPKYFVYLFQGGRVRQQVFDLCKGSSRIFLNQTILNSLEFPFCSLEEQQLIVDELESRLTVCDKIEETITNGLQQSEALRQSILKKAFEGKLIR